MSQLALIYLFKNYSGDEVGFTDIIRHFAEHGEKNTHWLSETLKIDKMSIQRYIQGISRPVRNLRLFCVGIILNKLTLN